MAPCQETTLIGPTWIKLDLSGWEENQMLLPNRIWQELIDETAAQAVFSIIMKFITMYV